MRKDNATNKLVKYHISKDYLGKVVTFYPRVPSSSVIKYEGDIPRVCFSTKLKHCLSSMGGSANATVSDILLEFKIKNTFPNPTVYITRDKLFLPPNASDFRDNDEYWAINHITLNFIGFIDLFQLTKNVIEITMERYSLTNEVYKTVYKDLYDLEIKKAETKDIGLVIPKDPVIFIETNFKDMEKSKDHYHMGYDLIKF